MRRGFEIVGSLELSLDDRLIEITADGTRVRAEIGDLAPGRPSLRFAASGFTLARRASRLLARSSLTLEVTRHGRLVAEIGAGVRGGSIARILGIANVRIVRGARNGRDA